MDTFQENESVIIYESETIQKLVTLDKSKKHLQNSKGTFMMESLIGCRNGQKVFNNKGTEYIYILKPTATLITNTVDHKTQIIYHMDISQIIMNLNLKNDSIVGESGTGSGSLSYSLSKVLPRGHLHTFEFNEERYQNAKNVLQQRLRLQNVSVYHRDVYLDGLYVVQQDGEKIEQNYMDAVFLDLPKPWLALEHAKKMLKQNGRICCFSPCIEQVQKNCQMLRQLGFIDINTVESLQRHFQVKSQQVYQDIEQIGDNEEDQIRKKVKKEFISHGPQKMRGHTAYLTFGILY